MAWITTNEGNHVNTEWFDEDERRKYKQIEENQKQAKEKNTKEFLKEMNKKDQEEFENRLYETTGEKSFIEKNEYGEVLFKAMVTDRSTGQRKALEFSSGVKSARDDLNGNGYSVTPRTLLPRKLFNYVMDHTNGHDWDWEFAQNVFKKELKGK